MSQGHPGTAFRRSIQRGNLVVAEIEARELGQLDLDEALELTVLVTLHEPERGRPYAVRRLKRWLEDAGVPTIEEAAVVAACPAAWRLGS